MLFMHMVPREDSLPTGCTTRALLWKHVFPFLVAHSDKRTGKKEEKWERKKAPRQHRRLHQPPLLGREVQLLPLLPQQATTPTPEGRHRLQQERGEGVPDGLEQAEEQTVGRRRAKQRRWK